jgi:hypothetical protein
MTNTTIEAIPAELHLVIVMTRERATLSSFWESREEAEKHIEDLTSKHEINPERGYLWATVTKVGVKSWKPNLPECKIAWVSSVQIS